MFDRILRWVARLVLAGIFFYAGVSKLYPLERRFQFEITLSSYQLLPEWAVIAAAWTLPRLEIALALLLLVGWKLRYVAGFTALLLTAFMGAMGITYARGIEANCGCFGLGEPISPTTLARDSIFLVLAFYLTISAWRAARLAPPPVGTPPTS